MLDKLRLVLRETFKQDYQNEDPSADFDFQGVSSLSQSEYPSTSIKAAEKQDFNVQQLVFTSDDPEQMLSQSLVYYLENVRVYFADNITAQPPTEPLSIQHQLQIMSDFYQSYRSKLQVSVTSLL